MDNKWRWSQVTDPKDRQVNESCKYTRSRTTIIFTPRTQLECGHRQSHCRSWNWVRSSSKNNSENCPSLCLSSVRPTRDMFTLHDKNAVSTQKHLGSNGTSIGKGVVSRTLKTIQWLVLWVERNKDNVNKSTLFRKWVAKHIFREAPEEAMCSVAYLQDEATLRLTYVIGKCRVATIRLMTLPKLEIQAAVYGVLLRKQILNERDVKIDKIYHWTRLINSATVATSSAQETTSVCCEQSSGNTGKLIDGSMETRQRYRKPCRHRNPRNVHRRPQGVRMSKRACMAPGRCRKVAKAVVPSERTRTWASYEYCSSRNKTRPTNWLETIEYLQPNQKLHCLLYEVQDEAERTPQSRRNLSSRANTVSICSNRKLPECFKVDSKEQRNLQNIKHCQIVTLQRGRRNN